ncbi:MAG: thioredoxin family protein [Bacteroidetes bacterium]|nr:thioredoxin family protein [Bacteroidota bacterium]
MKILKDRIMKIQFVALLLIVFAFTSCGKGNSGNIHNTGGVSGKDSLKYKVEFVELGSVNCVPCKKMQPVMKSIEDKYKGLVKVTFHDVWKDEAPAKKYGIDLIPTQVFLDANGKELMRHEGFFAEEEIDKFLQSRGVNIPQ